MEGNRGLQKLGENLVGGVLGKILLKVGKKYIN